VRVKICGLCSVADARAAERAGADRIGIILAPGFRRSQSLDGAARIAAAVTVPVVGVFVNQSAADVADAAARLRLAAVQLHGEESADDVAALRDALRRADIAPAVWKSVPVVDAGAAARALRGWTGAVDAVLLDGASAQRGGAGIAFDWLAAARSLERTPGIELIVAGGLTPHNVAAAIRALRPDAVDVSTGVEDAAGAKSEAAMTQFIAAARSAWTAAGNVKANDVA
jgi:phosphoribosylanthranilate isomerase